MTTTPAFWLKVFAAESAVAIVLLLALRNVMRVRLDIATLESIGAKLGESPAPNPLPSLGA